MGTTAARAGRLSPAASTTDAKAEASQPVTRGGTRAVGSIGGARRTERAIGRTSRGREAALRLSGGPRCQDVLRCGAGSTGPRWLLDGDALSRGLPLVVGATLLVATFSTRSRVRAGCGDGLSDPWLVRGRRIRPGSSTCEARSGGACWRAWWSTPASRMSTDRLVEELWGDGGSTARPGRCRPTCPSCASCYDGEAAQPGDPTGGLRARGRPRRRGRQPLRSAGADGVRHRGRPRAHRSRCSTGRSSCWRGRPLEEFEGGCGRTARRHGSRPCASRPCSAGVTRCIDLGRAGEAAVPARGPGPHSNPQPADQRSRPVMRSGVATRSDLRPRRWDRSLSAAEFVRLGDRGVIP